MGHLGTFLREYAQNVASTRTLSGSAMATCARRMKKVEKNQKTARMVSNDRPRTRAPVKHDRPTTDVIQTIAMKNLQRRKFR